MTEKKSPESGNAERELRTFVVGVDTMFGITAESPEAAEQKLAKDIRSGEIEVFADDCVTYEVFDENGE
jgi:hypothetical protein